MTVTKPPPLLKRNVSKLDINATKQDACFKCGEKIKGSWMICRNRKYHNKCFTCSGCKTEIGTGEFKAQNNDLWCPACFTEFCAPRCVTCEKPVEGASIVVMDMAMHPDCFKCEMCHNTLVSFRQAETTDSDKVLIVCGDCYEKIENIKEPEKGECGGCGCQIQEEETPWNWEGRQWHPLCFVCDKCEVQLGPENIPYKVENEPMCEGCASQPQEVFLCDACESELGPENPVVLVDELSFCRNCHRKYLQEEKKKACAQCKKKLTPEDRDPAGKPLTIDEKNMCKPCFKKHTCPGCAVVLTPENSGVKVGGVPHCRTCHSQLVCGMCAKELKTPEDAPNGRPLKVGDTTACLKCYTRNTCHNCKAVIDAIGAATARDIDGWRYCAPCQANLLMQQKREAEEHAKAHCGKCSKKLTEADTTHGLPYQLEGRNFCRPCYIDSTCRKCDRRLGPNDVDEEGEPLEIDGDKFCAICFDESVCGHCQNILGPKDAGPAGPLKVGEVVACRICFHDLTCAACTAELTDEDRENHQFLQIQGKKVCRPCFKKAEEKRLASVCAKCSCELGAEDMVLGKPRQIDGLPYCRECHARANDIHMCNHCRKPIKDVVVEARGKSYHRDCVACAYCKTNLAAIAMASGGNIRIDEEGHPCCEKCYKKNQKLEEWSDTGKTSKGDGFLQIRIRRAIDLYKDVPQAKEAYIVFKLGLQMLYTGKRVVAKAESTTNFDECWEFRKIDIQDTAFEIALMWKQKTMGKARIFLKDLVAGISSKQFSMEHGTLVVEFTWRPHSAAKRDEAFARFK